MSYIFTNDAMIGTLDTSIEVGATGATLACFMKMTNHPESFDYCLSLSVDATVNDFIALILDSTADQYLAFADATAGGNNSAKEIQNYDNQWAGWVGTYESDNTNRGVYVGEIGNTGSNTSSQITSNLARVVVGADANRSGDLANGKVAEIAIWNTVLSTADITAYLGGTTAADIGASNLRLYCPLDYDNTTQSNVGLDSAGDLTVNGAVYSSDHPTITSGVENTSIIVPTGPWR